MLSDEQKKQILQILESRRKRKIRHSDLKCRCVCGHHKKDDIPNIPNIPFSFPDSPESSDSDDYHPTYKTLEYVTREDLIIFGLTEEDLKNINYNDLNTSEIPEIKNLNIDENKK